ncbi:hypothetical protein AWZ03_001794 [Drosophila navojoa]|uniref:Uncharacterized protein n=1 Tax=Drosophila navojoa TaxID=7232 RepID=A0A484BSV5_DRONA|nr:hypothetical protein AWZ03_001794 [Drosophila navojoa]
MPNLFGELEQPPEQTAFNLEPVNASPYQLSAKAGNNSKCDSSLTPNVPSSSNVIEDLLKESHPPATTTTDTVLSMPNLFGELEQPPEQTAFNLDPVNASPYQLSAKAGDITYTISFPQELATLPLEKELPTLETPVEKELPVPKIPSKKELPTPMKPLQKELPKASIFQTPPRKASTLPSAELQPKRPTTNVTSSTTASRFLNAIKAQPVQSARPKRTRQPTRPDSSSGGATPQISTQDIKQTLERINKQK